MTDEKLAEVIDCIANKTEAKLFLAHLYETKEITGLQFEKTIKKFSLEAA